MRFRHSIDILCYSSAILIFNIQQTLMSVLTRDGHLLNMTYLQSMQEWLTSIIGGNANQARQDDRYYR